MRRYHMEVALGPEKPLMDTGEVIAEALRHAKGFTRVLGQDAVIDCHHQRIVTSALGMAARGAG
jgi:hypothetical protein